MSRTIRQAFWEDVLQKERKTWKLILQLREDKELWDSLPNDSGRQGLKACKSIIKRFIKMHKKNFPDAKIRDERDQ